ncbi:MAG: hypothetical protein CMO42_09535 [Verrucomicrobiales bacterium]|nr:hypothetical protein [Verrucomicrobiales bacterium]MBN77281.1 hypothetical protein [Verrucomicrobiaceae bacterium]
MMHTYKNLYPHNNLRQFLMKINTNRNERRTVIIREFFHNALALAVMKQSLLEASKEMNLQVVDQKKVIPRYFQG